MSFYVVLLIIMSGHPQPRGVGVRLAAAVSEGYRRYGKSKHEYFFSAVSQSWGSTPRQPTSFYFANQRLFFYSTAAAEFSTLSVCNKIVIRHDLNLFAPNPRGQGAKCPSTVAPVGISFKSWKKMNKNKHIGLAAQPQREGKTTP